MTRGGGNAVPAQQGGHLLRARPWHLRALDAQHLDRLGALEQRHGEGDGARRLGAVVPGDDDVLAEGLERRRRRHQHRAAALEQRILERRLGERGELGRALDDDEVVDPPEHADHGILAPGLLAPFGADTGARDDAIGRNVVPPHHGLEQRARLLAAVMALALERAVDLGRHREAHLAAEHHSIFGGERVERGDAAAEGPRRHDRGLENGARAAIRHYRQQGLHGDPQDAAQPGLHVLV